LSPAYLFYNALTCLAAPAVLAAALLRGRLRGNWSERFGFSGPASGGSGPRVWIHAVSVGEVQVAAALAEALKRRAPGLELWVSTTTAAGRSAAVSALGGLAGVLTFPFDFSGCPERALSRLRPDLVILLETELWPNFIKAARRSGAATMLANGRISPRSAAGYRRLGFLFREVLGYLDMMLMIREEDRDRVLSMGADPDRVRVAGNAKYALLRERVDADRAGALRREYGLDDGRPVLAAGSIRSGEEALLLEVFLRLRPEFPDLVLVLAPRHVDRAARIERLARDRGLSVGRRSRLGRDERPDVIVVDVMGELFYLYGLADAAFCGASLVPLGGQNPLEPAAWGRPVLYGPSMEDFLDARDLLEAAGAGRTVTGPDSLYDEVRSLLADPAEARRRGEAGRRALAGAGGSPDRLAEAALVLLEERMRRGKN